MSGHPSYRGVARGFVTAEKFIFFRGDNPAEKFIFVVRIVYFGAFLAQKIGSV